jgi:hypothetical protein
MHCCKVDEAARYIGADKLHANAIADIELLESAHEPALGDRPGNAYPRSFLGRPGHDAVELRADA